MSRFLVNLILAGFIGIAVFGFLAMGHEEVMHGACLAATVNRASCPSGVFEATAFYLNAFKSFSLAIFSLGANLTALTAIFILGIFSTTFFGIFFPTQQKQVFVSRLAITAIFFAKKNFLRWISLHENSPSIL